MTAVAEGLAIIIVSAAFMGFLARRTGQPTVVAYILTGLFLGPLGLDLVAETEFTKLLSELGLVFLLFLIGLEIDLDDIEEIIRPTARIGILQMAATFAAGTAVALIVGFNSLESIFIGSAVMFSSTALVVKLLSDSDEIATLPGKLDVGVLLVQDIAVVLLLALISTGATRPSIIAVEFLKIAAIIAGISFSAVLGGRYLLPTLFRKTRNSHSLFIYGVAWAFLFISLSMEMKISPEIGAFAAGLGLAQLPYDRELQERVRPLTDFFMAVFFINFGLNIVAENLSGLLLKAVIASALLMAVKFLVFFLLIDREKFTPETSFLGSINMLQVSEFGLILGGVALSQGFVGQEVVGFIGLVALLTMGSSSYLLRFNRDIYRLAEPYLRRFESDSKRDIEVEKLEDHAVIIGYNDTVERLLPTVEKKFDDVLLVDRDPEKAEELSRLELEYIFGDFKHGEIRNAAAVENADFVLSMAPDEVVNHRVIEESGRETTVFIESEDFEAAAELYERGADYIIIENVVTADKISDYLELYFRDPELFREEVEGDLESIYWGDRSHG